MLKRILLVVQIFAMSLIPVLEQARPFTFASVNQHTRTWKVYRNQRFGFSIKYLSSWKAEDTGGRYNPIVVILPRHPNPHEFYITVKVENRSLDEIRNSYAEFTRQSPASRFPEREIVFAGHRAYQFTRTDNPGFNAVYIPFSGNMYVVSAVRYDLAEVRQAMKTFQFMRTGV